VPVIAPAEAIRLAAAAAPDGIKGIFELTVQAVGRADGNIYLNSGSDYRDQRCLTIAVLPVAADDFRSRFGNEADATLKGRVIRVRGEARRVKISFTVNGQVTDKYYYQTHVNVSDAWQIELLDPSQLPPPQKEVEAAKITLGEMQRMEPGRPALAAYMYRLQQRIDHAFFQELRDHRLAGEGIVGSGHGLRLLLTVLADGRLGCDTEEVKLRTTQEPLLADAAFRALARITEKPEPFSPELKKEVGSSFTYAAHFSVQ
jgi:hypothetical protein